LIPGRGRRFFSIAKHPGRLWDPIGGSYPGDKVAGSVKLTTYRYLVPRSRTVELYLHPAIRLHGVVLNSKYRDNFSFYPKNQSDTSVNNKLS
jgi:hypothetical protein